MTQKLLKSQIVETLIDIRGEAVKYWIPILIGSSVLPVYLIDLWNIASITIPLWAAIALAMLLSLLTNLVVVRAYKYPKEPFFFDEVEFNWKVTERSKNIFSIEDIPYCKDHGHQLIQVETKYMCPDHLCSKCSSGILKWDDLDLLYKIAKSKVYSHVGRYKTKI